MNPAFYVLVIYGIIIFIGGLMGYLKAHSTVSLYTGLCFAIFFELCAIGAKRGIEGAIYIAAVGTLVLLIFFGYRFYHSHAWMPGGVMTILSAVVLIFLLGLVKGLVK